MAIENEELQKAIEELAGMMRGAGNASKGLDKDLTASQKALKAFGSAAGTAAKGLGSYGASLAKGETTIGSMTKVVDTAADAVTKMASSMPILGAAISAVAEGAKFLIQQIDATSKSFNEMSKVGASGADGMTGVFRQFTTAGLSLQSYTKVIGESSQAMARFRGMTSDGAEDFSKVVGQINGLGDGSDQTLRKLGLNADQMGSAAASFITQQTRLGRAQNMTNEQLAKGTIEYTKQLDGLSKLTGESREALQKEQDKALGESRFRANMDELVANGQDKQAQSLQNLSSMMNTFSPALGKGIRDLTSGASTTEESVALMNATGGAALDIINRVKSGQLSEMDAQKEIQKATQSHAVDLRNQAKYVDDANSSIGSMYAGISDFNKQDISKSAERINKTQDAQINKTDKLTDSTISAEKNLEKMSIEINKLGFSLMPQAAQATEKMTGAMKDMVKWVNKELGRSDEETQKQDDANWKQMNVGEKLESSVARGLEKAVGLVSDKGKNFLQGQRVENESEYLKNQGRPGVVAPGGASSGAGGGAAPAGGGSAGGGGGSGAGGGSNALLQGLNIKSGESTAGGDVDPKLATLASKIAEKFPGVRFTALNDAWHQQNSPKSKHALGQAVDFTLPNKPDAQAGAAIVSALKDMGFSMGIDEYNSPSAKATGGHIHAQLAKGGYLPNGKLGIVGENGPEIVAGPTNVTSTADTAAQMSGVSTMAPILAAQLEKLDELVTVMKSQVGVSQKILQYQS